MTESRVIRSAGAGWEGVESAPYKPGCEGDGCFRGTIRHPLIAATARRFDPRPGLRASVLRSGTGARRPSLERHDHAHAVVVIGGRGRVRLADRVEPIAPFDAVYVAPQEVHRFSADGGEPLRFICVVDRERDRPVLVEDDAEGGTT